MKLADDAINQYEKQMNYLKKNPEALEISIEEYEKLVGTTLHAIFSNIEMLDTILNSCEGWIIEYKKKQKGEKTNDLH
jgi:hypothetical protein